LTAEIDVFKNQLQSYTPVILEQSDDCKIMLNTITAERDGVHLAIDSRANQVIDNLIRTVQGPGTSLAEGTQDNKVHPNRVVCPEEPLYPCPLADWGTGNYTGGDLP
jgi:hypothetical protein